MNATAIEATGVAGTCDEILTAVEAAEFLRIDKKLLYKLIDNGELKAKRVGRVYRITKSALIAYLSGENK